MFESTLCLRQYHVKLENFNCYIHDEMVDFPKFGHIFYYQDSDKVLQYPYAVFEWLSVAVTQTHQATFHQTCN